MIEYLLLHTDGDRTYLLVDQVERRLVDETDIEALLPAAQDGVLGAVEHVTVRDNVTRLAVDDDLVLARDELVVIVEVPRAVLLEDPWHLRTSREDKPHAAVEEHALHDRGHLRRVGGEVEPRLGVRKTVVGEERVDTKVAGVVRHLVDCSQLMRGNPGACWGLRTS